MEVKGRVIKVLGITAGKGAATWRKQDVVIEQEGKFPKNLQISVWGDKIEQFNLKEGQRIAAEIDLESREYNGKWYTDVKVSKITSGMNMPELVDGNSQVIDNTSDELPW